MIQDIVLQPQEGPQTDFIKSIADIAIYGGAAGGGKSYGLLLDPLRFITNPQFKALIFRRTTKQVRTPGGLWDESKKIYYYLGARPKETTLEWNFPSGMQVRFAHLEHESNIYDYQGAQVPYIGFDELTHFTEQQFIYMLSRNRSSSGIPGRIRATTNPKKNSWVRKFLDWWIDPITGFAIPERSGVIRYFIRKDDQYIWADTREELIETYGEANQPKSVTFIPAKLEDNKILMDSDPTYKSNLLALNRVDREQLLNGNWNIEPSAGELFKRHWFEIVDAAPKMLRMVRCWDRAGTEKKKINQNKSSDPDFTAGVKMGKGKDGYFYIMDVEHEQLSSLGNERITINTARRDGPNVKVKIFQDPGSAGVHEKDAYVRLLEGFEIEVEKISRDKITAAKPLSAQAEAGNIRLLRGNWNEKFLSELENFPEGAHDDMVDGASGAFNSLCGENVGTFGKEFLPEQQNRIKEENNIVPIAGGESW